MQNSVNSITTNISNIFENGLYLKEYFSFIEEKHILADDTSLMKFPNSIKKELLLIILLLITIKTHNQF